MFTLQPLMPTDASSRAYSLTGCRSARTFPPSKKIDRPAYPRSIDPSALSHSSTQRIAIAGVLRAASRPMLSPCANVRSTANAPYSTPRALPPAISNSPLRAFHAIEYASGASALRCAPCLRISAAVPTTVVCALRRPPRIETRPRSSSRAADCSTGSVPSASTRNGMLRCFPIGRYFSHASSAVCAPAHTAPANRTTTAHHFTLRSRIARPAFRTHRSTIWAAALAQLIN